MQKPDPTAVLHSLGEIRKAIHAKDEDPDAHKPYFNLGNGTTPSMPVSTAGAAAVTPAVDARAEPTIRLKNLEGFAKRDTKSRKTRQAIVAYVIAMPGSLNIDISQKLDINSGHVSTILRDLMSDGLVKTQKGNTSKGARFYFFNQAIPDFAEAAITVAPKPKSVKPATSDDGAYISAKEFTKRYGFCENYPYNLKKIRTRIVLGGNRGRHMEIEVASIDEWIAGRVAKGQPDPSIHKHKYVPRTTSQPILPVNPAPKKRGPYKKHKKPWVYTKARQQALAKAQAARRNTKKVSKGSKGFFAKLFS